MRDAPVSDIRGPFIHAPLWGWKVATYFWLGGTASGSAFVALACDAAGDHRSAAIARKVALGVVAPAPALLIADLGRPERFLKHYVDPRAALADEHGRAVPKRVQRLGRPRGRVRPDRATEGRPDARRARPRCSAAISAPTPACCGL